MEVMQTMYNRLRESHGDVFANISQRIFMYALGRIGNVNGDGDLEVVLDNPVFIEQCGDTEIIESLYLGEMTAEVHLCATDSGHMVGFVYDVEDLQREDVLKVVCELMEMCSRKNDITSFFYYMWNKWSEDECKIVFSSSCGGYKHYWGKWCYYCEEYGIRAAVDWFYSALDTGNRNKLVARALEMYDGNREIK